MHAHVSDGDLRTRARRNPLKSRSGAVVVALLALLAFGLAFAPAGALAQRPTPINLQLKASTNAILATWGVSSTSGLSGFRIRWRRDMAGAAGGWSDPAELSATARSYGISGVKAGEYEVRLRALYKKDRLGGSITRDVVVQASGEEPPVEEEVPVEEPVEEEEPTGEEEAPVEESEGSTEPIWYADPAAPILEDWASIQAEPGRITETPDAAMPYGFAYADEIRNGDDPGGYGERSEVGEGNPTRRGLEDRLFNEGQDRWIAFPFILGADFPINTKEWYVLMQIKQLGGLGTPILSMGSDERGDGGLALFNSDTNHESSGNIVRWDGKMKIGQLTKIVLHVKFSPDPSVGFVELYGDLDGSGVKLLMGKTYMSTMKVLAGVTVADHARIGQYRDSTPKSGTSHVDYGRYAVATSREVAETYAFE